MNDPRLRGPSRLRIVEALGGLCAIGKQMHVMGRKNFCLIGSYQLVINWRFTKSCCAGLDDGQRVSGWVLEGSPLWSAWYS